MAQVRELRLPEVNKLAMVEPMAAREGRIAELVWSHPVLLQTSSLQRDSQVRCGIQLGSRPFFLHVVTTIPSRTLLISQACVEHLSGTSLWIL